MKQTSPILFKNTGCMMLALSSLVASSYDFACHADTNSGCKVDTNKPLLTFGRPSKRQQRRNRR